MAEKTIAENRIGRILSMNIYSSTAGFGPVVPDAYLNLEDPASFANLITIHAPHTIDLAIDLAGDLESLWLDQIVKKPVLLND
jgi:predicted dehydrogenase